MLIIHDNCVINSNLLKVFILNGNTIRFDLGDHDYHKFEFEDEEEAYKVFSKIHQAYRDEWKILDLDEYLAFSTQ